MRDLIYIQEKNVSLTNYYKLSNDDERKIMGGRGRKMIQQQL